MIGPKNFLPSDAEALVRHRNASAAQATANTKRLEGDEMREGEKGVNFTRLASGGSEWTGWRVLTNNGVELQALMPAIGIASSGDYDAASEPRHRIWEEEVTGQETELGL